VLFSLKANLPASLLAAAVLAGSSLLGIQALDLPVDLRATSWAWVLGGAGLLLSSDAVLHILLRNVAGEAYRSRFQTLIEYFRGQGFGEIAAGSVLAASEEVLFRGLLLTSLINTLGAPSPLSLSLTAGAFGLAHLIPKPWAWPFAVWAVWEGILLGAVYLASGSLLAVALAHAIHDAAGFVVFARIRGRGVS
jgi:membrane protease YdiL (CAAX protease family)